MAVKIRLKRMGKIRAPFYRIVVADARTKRDGRVIEEIGTYNPKADPSVIHVDSERAQYWLGVGAQPTEPVAALFRVTGDWQKFKGEPAPEPMKVAEARRSKTDIFNEALKDAQSEPRTEAVTSRRSRPRQVEEKPVEEKPVEDTATVDEAAEAARTEAKPADEQPADEQPADEQAAATPAAPAEGEA